MDFLRIVPLFDFSHDPGHQLLYTASLRNALNKLMPGLDEDKKREQFYELLPLMKWSAWEKGSLNLSLFLLCRSRPHAGKFFYDMVSRWLLPGKPLNVGLFFTTDFKLPDIDSEIYTFAELILHLQTEEELEEVARSLPVLEAEIKLGVSSIYQASRILEIKGLSADEKTAQIQEKISTLLHRRPLDFDDDIFSQMQHFLVVSREEFKSLRDTHHMSRIISLLYLFRKTLKEQIDKAPEKRRLCLKVMRARLHYALGVKQVLAVFVGMNFLKENEVFEERHLLKACRGIIPGVKVVSDSLFFKENKEEKIRTIYLEIQKESGIEFTAQEIAKLRQKLPQEIKNQVEHLIRPIFMPRNEEEVMRNIVTLSRQVKYARDLPHVILLFDGQSDSDLSFSVILVRVSHPDLEALEEVVKREKSAFKIVIDRIKKVAHMRGKYYKEAVVMRMKIGASDFVREDHSVDLYKARRQVIVELEKLLGEVRDFNGGMIAKQMETFFQLQQLLGEEIALREEFLLENFFHSIYPIEWRSVLDAKRLKSFFLLLLEAQEGAQFDTAFHVKVREEEGAVILLIALKEAELKEAIFDAVSSLKLPPSQLATLHLKSGEILYLGYTYFCNEKAGRNEFVHQLTNALPEVVLVR
jgi:hypothetical protein